MLLAQISDLHIRAEGDLLAGRLDMRPFTAAAVDAVNRWAPDAVIVTGDLTDIGSAGEYAIVRAELDRLTAPWFAIPGNHDRREPMRTAFADRAWMPGQGSVNWIIEDLPVRVIGLDTLVEGRPHGELTAETLDWLDAALAATDRPTLVTLHHPPFASGFAAMDGSGLTNGAALAAIVARHPHVERVTAGHQHRPVTLRWAGTTAQIAPGVAHQVALDFRRTGLPDWVLEPPAFLLHRWEAATGLVTHTVCIDPHGGPQPFRADPGYAPLDEG